MRNANNEEIYDIDIFDVLNMAAVKRQWLFISRLLIVHCPVLSVKYIKSMLERSNIY